MQEVEVTPQPLQLEGQVPLELKEEPALVLRSQRRTTSPLEDEASDVDA
jgi:hypothetical protein